MSTQTTEVEGTIDAPSKHVQRDLTLPVNKEQGKQPILDTLLATSLTWYHGRQALPSPEKNKG